MKKTTKRINKQFEHRHFNVRVISYSFYESFLGGDGTASVEITDMNDRYKAKVTIRVEGQGWNWYGNCANMCVIERSVIDWLKSFD
jgi:hypothetical protein